MHNILEKNVVTDIVLETLLPALVGGFGECDLVKNFDGKPRDMVSDWI